MTKRKRKKRRRPPRQSRRSTRQTLEATFERADRLIAQGRPQAAIDLLEPLLAAHPREAELHYYLGYARVQAGDFWAGLERYERAIELGGDPSYRLALGSLYVEAEFYVHALRTWRPVLEQTDYGPMVDQVRTMIPELEAQIANVTRGLGIEPPKAEEGLYHVERGRRALAIEDYKTAITANRRAIQFLGNWSTPLNNLATALFYDGHPEQAIVTCRQVLEQDPDNVHALSNAIRYLVWTGREAEARPLWDRLRTLAPRVPTQRFKIAEAAADLQEDEHVYRTLNPPGGPLLSVEMPARFASQIEFILAVAEANIGRHNQAIRRLEALRKEEPGVENLLIALRAGKPGIGWAERFPYVNYSDLFPSDEMEEFAELVVRQEDLQERRFRRQVERFVQRYPQIVLVAEKVIWEAELPDLGIPMLAAIANPAAHAALRRFALSQAGEDEVRIRALGALEESGGLAPDEWVQVWLDGAWETVRMREYELFEGPAFEYSQQVADLLNDGLAAMQAGDDEQAERLYRQALELEPDARQAYNNLGTIYRNRGEKARAREMFEAALQADPTYVYPRCTLANDLIDAGDMDGAEEMLSPLRDVTRLQPAEMSLYSYTQARILIGRKEYDKARRVLKSALHFTPDYEPAQELLERIGMIVRLQTGFDSFMERTRAHTRSTRTRLQAKLSTPNPTLAQVLPLYTKDALTGMARVVLPWGGWSALRKAELIDEIVAGFREADNLGRIVDQLGPDERAALHQVLAEGGSMAWAQFDAAYGNDLDGSPYGNYERSKTAMGRLRGCGLLVETTVDGELRIAIPFDLRAALGEILG